MPNHPGSHLKRGAEAFFDRASTHRLIETLAAERTDAHGERVPVPLTIFAGAGVSRDSGSPAWDDLVERILIKQLDDSQPLDRSTNRLELATNIRVVARQLVSAYGPLAAASAIVELHMNGDRRERMSLADMMPNLVEELAVNLYPKDTAHSDGVLAQAIVRLSVFWKTLGADIAIITTNYDDNLERFAEDPKLEALAKERGIAFEALTDGSLPSPMNIPVYHLHGYVPRRGQRRGNFAFSEAGLHQGDEILNGGPAHLDWRSEVLRRRIVDSNTLFIGTTLRDPTVANALLDAKVEKEQRRAADPLYSAACIGVFPSQGDLLELGSDVADLAARILSPRLAHLGMEMARPDFFGQVPQLLNEVILCFQHGSTYGPSRGEPYLYGDRLSAWWRAWKAAAKPTTATSPSRDQCQKTLARAKQKLRRIEAWGVGDSETIKLEIWVRMDPKKRTLALWGTSESVNRVSGTMHECPIELDSKYFAVNTFCRGTGSMGDGDSTGRWKSHFSVPIQLTGAKWNGITVGVVNLVSTMTTTDSVVSRWTKAGELRTARAIMEAAGVSLLDPPAP